MFFAVRLQRGGPWDWGRDLREQDGWDEHARFMDALVEDGFVVLGGPLAGEREILHAVSAPSEEAVRERLAQDIWHQNGMLMISISGHGRGAGGEAFRVSPDLSNRRDEGAARNGPAQRRR